MATKRAEVQEISVGLLKPWGRNPRRHDVDRIAKSIERFGFRSPLVVNRRDGEYVVEAGHGRLKAAQKLGLKTLPCVVVEEDDKTAEAFAIADNRLQELTEWDYPELADILKQFDENMLDTIGYSQEELDTLIAENQMPKEGLTDDDAIPGSWGSTDYYVEMLPRKRMCRGLWVGRRLF